jgi:hypothetical protein
MMLGQPESPITPLLRMLRKVDRPRDRASRRLPRTHSNQVQHCYRQTHIYLDELIADSIHRWEEF